MNTIPKLTSVSLEEKIQMRAESSVQKILWSLAYLVFALVALRVSIMNQPVNVGDQQGQRKSVAEAYSTNPQLKISRLKVGAEPKEFKEEFDETDDWTRRLSFEIDSLAVKPITFLQINLKFPDTLSTGNIMVYQIRLGNRPGASQIVSENPLYLKPGGKMKIEVANDYQQLEKFIRARHSMKDIQKVELEVGFIGFEDGTGWAAGDFLQPDPNNPRRFINVGRTFPK
jgi:hypothetical protein